MVIHSDKYEIIKNFAEIITHRAKLDDIKQNDLQEIVGNSNGKAKDRIVSSILKMIDND